MQVIKGNGPIIYTEMMRNLYRVDCWRQFFCLERRIQMVKRSVLIGLCVVLIGLLVLPAVVTAGDKININTATKDQLTQLKGVGPVIADRIIEYRDKNGKFKTVEEITEVKGIGKGTFEVIKELITVE